MCRHQQQRRQEADGEADEAGQDVEAGGLGGEEVQQRQRGRGLVLALQDCGRPAAADTGRHSRNATITRRLLLLTFKIYIYIFISYFIYMYNYKKSSE